ncbi:hypothetical protein [Sphingopyxis sp. KK2]|uniref:hypothetical protein n=1 Tax=Sphingopyxis sp. KK2 TaxID=1855727 RepID=UPI00097E6CD0|nr:hypothetical protein [Sphingopyxis sp. KK2]
MTTATPPSAPKSRRLRILHGIGYLTTTLVGIQLLFIAFMVGSDWWDRRQIDLRYRESTRTHDGPLTNIGSEGLEESAALLAALPTASQDAPDSFRIVIEPSLSLHSYALSLIPANKRESSVAAEFVTLSEDACDSRAPLAMKRRTFTLSPTDYRQFASWFDAKTEGYDGSNEGVLDGTSVSFERRKAGRTTSGSGNVPDHHGELAARLLQLVKPHIKGADIPTDPSWHIAVTTKDCEN